MLVRPARHTDGIAHLEVLLIKETQSYKYSHSVVFRELNLAPEASAQHVSENISILLSIIQQQRCYQVSAESGKQGDKQSARADGTSDKMNKTCAPGEFLSQISI